MFNVLAQTLMKIGAERPPINLSLALSIFCQGLSFIIYIGILSKVQLSAAYPVVIGLTIISTVCSGSFYFHEKITFFQIIGISFILIGVLFFAFDELLRTS